MPARRTQSWAGRRGSPSPTGSSAPWSGTSPTAPGGIGCATASTEPTTRRTTGPVDERAGDRRERSGGELRGGAPRRGRREGGRRGTRSQPGRAGRGRIRRAGPAPARGAARADRVHRRAHGDPLRRDDRRRRLRERPGAGLDRERARRRGRCARLPGRARAAGRALHRLRLRRRAGAVLGRRRPQPAGRLRPHQARRRGGRAAAGARLRGGAGGGRLQRPPGREAHLRHGRRRAAPRGQGGARLPRPGGVSHARRQRGGDGHRPVAQRPGRDLALRGRLDRLPRRVLPRAGAEAARRRAAGGAGSHVRGEASGAAARALWPRGDAHPAPPRAVGPAGAGRGARSIRRGARGVIEAAQQTRPDAVPAAAPALAQVRSSRVAEVWRFRQLIALLVVRELKVRYKRSVLGLLWTMLNPLLLMVVYAVVFTTIMAAAQPNFSVFLLAGLLPWLYFSTSLMQGLMSVLANQELVRKIRLPQAFTPALLFLPAAALVLTLFCAGVTLLFATATVFFRDVRHLTEVLLQVLLYLSPVLYDLKQLGEHRTWWFQLFRLELRVNPLSYLIPLVRDPVYYGRLPSLPTVAVALAWAAGALLLGFAVFTRLEPRHIHHL